MTALQKSPFFLTQVRWQIALCACLGMALLQGMRCNFPAAKIAMMEMDEFNWTEHEIAHFESAFFYGYSVSQIPAGILATKLSPTRIFGFAVFLAGLCNVLTVLSFSCNFNMGVILAQILQGIGHGLSQPATHGVLRLWAPLQERTKLTSVSFMGLYLGVMFGAGLSPTLTILHWSGSFYFYAGLVLLWTLLWFCISATSPRTHRSICEAELNYIISSIGEDTESNVKLTEIPWLKMVTSVPVWATIIVNIALNWNIYMFINQQLYYLNAVFDMPAEQAGWIVAPSQILQTVVVTITATLSDRFMTSGRFSKKLIRKGFLGLGLLAQTACLVGLGTVAINSYIAVALMIAACAVIGCSFAPFLVNQFDLAPSYAPLILGLDNTLGALAGVSGYVIEPLAAQGESGWKTSFLIGAAVNVVGLLVFQFFGSVEVQSWAEPGKKNSNIVLALDSSELQEESEKHKEHV
ncbi:hypothetical protein QR680_009974 [Steinernema hermaphroditum]|uniref:Major facilitator superfamily (MFS) profile domain-containing protein n=1 Tax=Steinernema hermaphroditum TaxID=289476 RepID=A0AA39INY5_9BILA|nr:hypothetical protein QR680_009974 [Steinernema hermaphroditum]